MKNITEYLITEGGNWEYLKFGIGSGLAACYDEWDPNVFAKCCQNLKGQCFVKDDSIIITGYTTNKNKLMEIEFEFNDILKGLNLQITQQQRNIIISPK